MRRLLFILLAGTASAQTVESEIVLDAPTPVPSSTARHPSVAWGGASWLVVWDDDRRGVLDEDVFAARVDAAGRLLDPVDLALPLAAWDLDAPPAIVATGDGGWLVAARGLVKVAADGTVIALAGPQIDDAPALATNGDGYLLVSVAEGFDDARVIATALDGTGAASSGWSTLDENGYTPSLASNGDAYVVAWSENFAEVTDAIVSPTDGTLTLAQPLVAGASPSVTAVGGGYQLVWSDGGVRAATLDGAGQLIASTETLLDAGGTSPTVTLDGQQPLVTWQTAAGGVAAEHLGDATATVVATDEVFTPTSAASGDGALVVYGRADGETVALPLDEELTPRGELPLAYAAPAELSPAVAWDGARYAVAWMTPAGGHVVLLDADGKPGAAQDVGPGATHVRVAGAPGGFLVAWTTAAGGDTAALTDDGTLGPPNVADTSDDDLDVDAAWDGAAWQVVWSRELALGGALATDGSEARIAAIPHGATLVVDANHGDVEGHLLGGSSFTIADSPFGQTAPAVATDGQKFLAAWLQTATDVQGEWTVLAAFVGADGTVGKPFTLLGASGGYDSLSIAWTGERWLVAWQQDGAVSALTVDERGKTSAVFPIAAAESPALASAGDGRALVAYDRFDAAPPFGNAAVRARFVAPAAAARGCACSIGGGAPSPLVLLCLLLVPLLRRKR